MVPVRVEPNQVNDYRGAWLLLTSPRWLRALATLTLNALPRKCPGPSPVRGQQTSWAITRACRAKKWCQASFLALRGWRRHLLFDVCEVGGSEAQLPHCGQAPRFAKPSGGEDVPFSACLRPCPSIQRGAYITTGLVVAYAPPAVHCSFQRHVQARTPHFGIVL